MATLSVPPSEHEQAPRATALGGVFFWGAMLLLIMGIVAYLVIGFGIDHFTDADAARVLERQKILQDRVTEDYKYLHDKPSWFKKDAGLVRVPIDEAMAMTLPVLQASKPHPAYPIAQSPPQNASAPTSPDKGQTAPPPPGKTNDNAPAASNPTVGQPALGPGNNSNNPGNPPVPGTQLQPPAPPAQTNTSGAVPAASPAAQAAPLINPPAPAATVSPAAAATPTPNPQSPGASPAGTP